METADKVRIRLAMPVVFFLLTRGTPQFILGSLSIVGVGFIKIPLQFYEKGSFYVWFQVLLILGMPNKRPHHRPFYPMMYSGVSAAGTV